MNFLQKPWKLDETIGPAQPDVKAKNFLELFEPVRGLPTDEEVDFLFSRNRSPARPLDLG
jgi:hypothetical protein